MIDEYSHQPVFLEEEDEGEFRNALGREPLFKKGDKIAYHRKGIRGTVYEVLTVGSANFFNDRRDPALLLKSIITGSIHPMMYNADTEQNYEKMKLPASE